MEDFWHNQRTGVESVTWFDTQELVEAGWPAQMVAASDYVPASAVIDDADLFDAEFFGYSPHEAEIMDPQHRLFAECARHAIDDSGHDPSRFDGPVGVYAGCFANKYLPLNLTTNEQFRRSSLALNSRIYNDKDFLATRVAYLCDLRGPAITVQTACSTSLVAVHLACQALLSHECDMALAGGVALAVPLVGGYPGGGDGVFSPDGHCRPFDAAGGGTVPGYGSAVVVLRRLSDALADSNHIRALILGSAVNNDGSAKFGFGAPSVQAQAEVIATAQSVAGVAPETVGYVEAHGTATTLGDPIEVAGLAQAFNTRERGFCALGSVKANIGHLDAAAGVASLSRAVLALEHGEIPPTINFRTPNPALRLDSTPFYIPTDARSWPADTTPRRAGVSSFGIGGTNAHVVLQEAPAPRPATVDRHGWQLLVLSARTKQALTDAAANLAGHLDRHDELAVADAAYTMQAGRQRFPLRRHVVCRDRAEAVAALQAPDRPGEGAVETDARQVIFMFPGTASYRPGAGAELYRGDRTFAEQVDRCVATLSPRLGYDFFSTRPRDPRGVAAAAFTTQWALAGLWQSWGVSPAAMIGDGDGEYVAACVAGVLDVADALEVAVASAEGVQGAAFARAVARYERKPPRVPFISGVTGTWISPEEAVEPDYWSRHLTTPARFADGLAELATEPGRVLLEVGPGNRLTSIAAARRGPVALSSMPPPDQARPEVAHLFDTVGRLWRSGVEIDWDAVHGEARPRRVPLPGYPFQRRRHWLEPDSGSYVQVGYREM
jgi:acyl transferase domain-containing protein